jgi:sugar phosphate isomerase/epimerase
MQVIASTAPFFLRPVREAFRHIADAGFEQVEVMITRDPDTQDPSSLFAAASAFGLSVRAVHSPSLIFTRRVWGTDPIGKVGRAIAMAEMLGAGTVIAHPPYRWQGDYSSWLRDEMPAVSAAASTAVAMENMFPLRIRNVTGPSLREPSLDGFEHVTLDTSHAAVSGADIRDAAAQMGSRLTHVHLSDNAGKGWDSHLPVGQGVLPLAELLDDLRDRGFDGAVSLELDLRRWMKDPQGMKDVLIRNREFCFDSESVVC